VTLAFSNVLYERFRISKPIYSYFILYTQRLKYRVFTYRNDWKLISSELMAPYCLEQFQSCDYKIKIRSPYYLRTYHPLNFNLTFAVLFHCPVTLPIMSDWNTGGSYEASYVQYSENTVSCLCKARGGTFMATQVISKWITNFFRLNFTQQYIFNNLMMLPVLWRMKQIRFTLMKALPAEA
jgi:hypothetical protein